MATPPFFTDLLDDFLADPALGVALVLGVVPFFVETALGVFFADALGVFLADELLGVLLAALGVAALEAAGDSSSLWRLLDF